jgi:hypothetical protein
MLQKNAGEPAGRSIATDAGDWSLAMMQFSIRRSKVIKLGRALSSRQKAPRPDFALIQLENRQGDP